MIKTIEFKDDLKVTGNLITVKSNANDKFIEWQKTFKGKKPEIISVQKIDNGIFVVHES